MYDSIEWWVGHNSVVERSFLCDVLDDDIGEVRCLMRIEKILALLVRADGGDDFMPVSRLVWGKVVPIDLIFVGPTHGQEVGQDSVRQ